VTHAAPKLTVWQMALNSSTKSCPQAHRLSYRRTLAQFRTPTPWQPTLAVQVHDDVLTKPSDVQMIHDKIAAKDNSFSLTIRRFVDISRQRKCSFESPLQRSVITV